jgi:hypothetical protein
MEMNAKVFYERGSCWVVCDAEPIVGLKGKYILWMDGTPMTLLKLFTEHSEEISVGHDVYFLLRNKTMFRNHVERVEHPRIPDLWVHKRKDNAIIKT